MQIGAGLEDRAPDLWRRTGAVSLTVTALLGLLYAGTQLVARGTIEDPVMIVLVIANVTAVQVFGLFIASRLDDMFVAFGDTPEAARTRVGEVMGNRWAPYVGLGYGAIFGATSWYLDPWGGEMPFRALLALFILSGSVFIGVAIFAIFRYWRVFLVALPSLDLRILTLARPPLLPFLRLNSLIVTTTAAVACSAIIAALFSKFDFEGQAVVVFSLFTLAIAALTYAVPIFPLSNKLRFRKAVELDRIDRLIEAHARRLTGQKDRTDGDPVPAELPKLDDLREMRAIVSAVRTLPPGGQVSVSAAAIVAFLSFLPSILEYAKGYLGF